MKSKKALIIISIIIGFIAFFAILKATPLNEITDTLKKTNPKIAISYFIISISIMAAHTWRWKVILKSQKIIINFKRLFLYRVAGYGISYLTPSAKMGGEPIRAALLSKHGITFSKALSSIIIDKTIDVAACAIFFFIGVLTVLFQFALPKETGIMMLAFSIVFLTVMMLIYQRMMSGKGVICQTFKKLRLHKLKKFKDSERKLQEFEKTIIKFFKEDKTDFTISILISGLTWVLMFIEYKIIGLMLGVNLPFIVIFLIVSFIGAAFIIPVPMAMGTQEAGQVVAFSIARMNTGLGLAVSLIVRARDLLFSIAGIIILSYFGLDIGKTIKKIYNNSEKSEE